MSASKDDKGKMRFDLIPPKPLFYLAEVFTIGAKKYDDRNWEKGLSWCRVFRAMMSHAWKWFGREKFDKDTGQHHLASVAWCALALMEYEDTNAVMDDRPRKVDLSQFDPVKGADPQFTHALLATKVAGTTTAIELGTSKRITRKAPTHAHVVDNKEFIYVAKEKKWYTEEDYLKKRTGD